MVRLSRESSGGWRASNVSIPKYALDPDLWYSGGRVTVHWVLLWRKGLMWDGIRNGLDMELPEAILVGKGRGPFTVGITWRKRQTKVTLLFRYRHTVAFYSSLRPCGHICSLTMADSGPAWSSRSSRSSPMMSASKSELVSSIGQGLLVLHPLTNVGTGRGTDEDTDTGRETDSKPGGSDTGTEEILLLGGSSSTTASFRGGCTATGAWIGAGTGATTLLSGVSWGTSKTQQGKTASVTFVLPSFNYEIKAVSY